MECNHTWFWDQRTEILKRQCEKCGLKQKFVDFSDKDEEGKVFFYSTWVKDE